MDLNFLEIEIKFPLSSKEKTLRFLNENGIKLKSDIHQKDCYYLPLHRNFLDTYPVVERLRTRESVKWNSINYKNRHIVNGENINTCDEYETKVESMEALKKILDALNFKQIICVEKNRNIRNYKWIEISVDEVDELGSFIELEAKWEFRSNEDATNHLHKILAEIWAEIWEQDFEWYPYLLLKKHWLLKK